ncbi:protein RarD [Veronia nyctiphanis]|uniref:Protein RarD n=1 Tax=Veronia nyctiphanis TaxID=1278244 RepID=A0A4Q0YLE2_9GAMM|nr:EamA family transporter RarD [Veronia nyctiphanis]RXJ71580.1 protein RarD [Veronia nyctiphanis]
MTNRKSGNLLAALAFVLWGFMPLYYQFIPNAAMDELNAVRLTFAVPIISLAFLIFKRKLPDFKGIWKDKASLLYSLLSAIFMSVSWIAFISALTNNNVLEASMGFFINPLVVIALGIIFLKERLSTGQKLAVLLGAFGLGYEVYQYGELPLAALQMATFFALYGLAKKQVNYDTLTSLFVEHFLLLPFALGYLFYKLNNGTIEAINTEDISTLLFYVGAAPVTLLPLFIFNAAVKRTSLSMIGFMQYIEPSLQFLCAILIFGEMFDHVKAVSFGMIWLGLAILVLEGLFNIRRRYSSATSSHT